VEKEKFIEVLLNELYRIRKFHRPFADIIEKLMLLQNPNKDEPQLEWGMGYKILQIVRVPEDVEKFHLFVDGIQRVQGIMLNRSREIQ
jgi:hypothetical protein